MCDTRAECIMKSWSVDLANTVGTDMLSSYPPVGLESSTDA